LPYLFKNSYTLSHVSLQFDKNKKIIPLSDIQLFQFNVKIVQSKVIYFLKIGIKNVID